jgi:5-methylcytosine-specific restriction endonuclease McrA
VIDATSKTCTKCGETKVLEEFHRDKSQADGRTTRCRSCRVLAKQRYDDQNREAVNARQRKQRAERPEHERERARQTRQRNLEAAQARERAYHESHRDERRAYTRQYYAAHRDERLVRSREYHAANREARNARSSQWKKENPDRGRDYNHRRRARIAEATIEAFTLSDMFSDWEEHDLYGCFFCGRSLADGYEIEHFYPLTPADGVPQGSHALFNLVPSCKPCNGSKHNRDPWAFLERSLAARDVDLDECLTSLDAIMRRRR